MTNLRTFLDASTDHLPQRFFDPTLVVLTGAHHTEVGLLLWVPPSPDGCKGEGGTDDDNAPEVVELRRFAREAGAAYVFLDRDAEHVPGLAVYSEPTEACGRCGGEFPAGEACSGPGYHP